ncbi:HVO_A0114 family putative DNA-binding protein [Methanobrevibacter curvatus]|uniref:MarR family protein n=1 Tax=Methanobrevibacter curvatus TaxID=49547 RepID=A0A166DUU7_9EURY|nr:winged helix DNA-binding protein [Methanobrevibacter curvatus]KZX15974.1 hypothetical protein MBCUR_01490 [Methanobrevibacter curvatus]
MRITLIKEQTAEELIGEMENTYGSLEKLEKKAKITNNRLFYSDLEAWKYYLKHLDESIKETHTVVTNKIALSEFDINILNTIKTKNPESISELSRLLDKNTCTVLAKVKKLSENGFIELKDGKKNRKIPIVSFDEITIAI